MLTLFLLAQLYQPAQFPARLEWKHWKLLHYEVAPKTDAHGEATISYDALYPECCDDELTMAHAEPDRVKLGQQLVIRVVSQDAKHITIRTKPHTVAYYVVNIAIRKTPEEEAAEGTR